MILFFSPRLQIAIAAKHHNVPFYVAAPLTTIDVKLTTGEEIVIEQRPGEELTHMLGQQIAAPGIGTWNPAFDVTPASLITGVCEFWRPLPQKNGIGHPTFYISSFLSI